MNDSLCVLRVVELGPGDQPAALVEDEVLVEVQANARTDPNGLDLLEVDLRRAEIVHVRRRDELRDEARILHRRAARRVTLGQRRNLHGGERSRRATVLGRWRRRSATNVRTVASGRIRTTGERSRSRAG